MNIHKKLSALPVTAAFLLAACAPAQPVDVTKTEPDDAMEEEVMEDAGMESAEAGDEVSYYPEKEAAKGYLAVPEGEGPFPGIILIHEWWGMNDDIRRKAQEFADEGYVALAVDLYDGQSAATPDEARALATSVRENVDEAFNNLGAAVDYLKGLGSVDGERLASVGWCFGGQWSYEMARNDLGTDVSIMYYGRFHPEDDLEMMKALIIGHFGEEDASIAVDDVKEFQITLGQHDERHEIYIYENAGHAFANNDSDAYVEDAAELAWKRTLDFLKDHL